MTVGLVERRISVNTFDRLVSPEEATTEDNRKDLDVPYLTVLSGSVSRSETVPERRVTAGPEDVAVKTKTLLGPYLRVVK